MNVLDECAVIYVTHIIIIQGLSCHKKLEGGGGSERNPVAEAEADIHYLVKCQCL